MAKFAKRGDCLNVGQSFDKENITITKGGKTYNVYDAIQANNVDTDIYEVLKKYHCTEEQGIEYMNEHGGVKGVYEDICNLQKRGSTLADFLDIQSEAQSMFEQLPVEIKQKYQNNLADFLKENAKKENAKKQETEPQTDKKQNNPSSEVKSNETK